MPSSRFPVAVILQRTPLANRWVDERWEPVAIESADAASLGAVPQRISDDATGTRWRFAGHWIELHRSEAEGYFLNITAPEPKVFVMWRMTEARSEPPVVPVIVTVSYNEAARMLDGGEQVDAVPMPPAIRSVLEPFVAVHYKPEPKRKVRRNDPFADDAMRHERKR
jgi:hypothetical protein